ncbi:YbaK/prolyl-tRNA synthetase associated region [Reticulomyxa filosa]|uniref:YbaK/prolyl-tRNA synthetase associated region n=1 Tax=Reticulomyxa filosa TaxID=46433 RepID=X6PFJ3_RETFI|nr:YbaK/prolyl-tRNA synthetase associated region [Reticulomyxa filosa]|eukprot:ETO36432.1 YbaK/prolyl-tRNA synthetase associated region [Reticulomyxa filosa]
MSSDFLVLLQRQEQLRQRIHSLTTTLESLPTIKGGNKDVVITTLNEIRSAVLAVDSKIKEYENSNMELRKEINDLRQQLEQLDSHSDKSNTDEVKNKSHVDTSFTFQGMSIPLNDDQHAQRVYDLFKQLNIEHKVLNHEPVYTCEQASKYDNLLSGAHCKNLFIKDKKNNFCLISAVEDTPIRLNQLGKVLKDKLQGKISFAKEEELKRQLGVIAGAVTPLALINDVSNSVQFIMDERFKTEFQLLNFHPCVNTATITLAFDDFVHKFLKHLGRNPVFIDFKSI